MLFTGSGKQPPHGLHVRNFYSIPVKLDEIPAALKFAFDAFSRIGDVLDSWAGGLQTQEKWSS